MNKTFIKLLLIEDNQADVVLLQVTLERDPHIEYGITAVEQLSAGIQKIHEAHFDVILLDLGLPDSQGLDTFQQVHAVDASLPIVVLSGLMDEALALQAVHLGAQDYVVKGTTGWDSLSRLIRYAMERKQAEAKIQQGEEQYRYLFDNNPLPMWTFDQETLAFLAVNDAAVEKYGYSRAEFLSMTIADIRPPEDLERFRQDHRYPSSRLYHSDKWRHKLKNGQIINVEITSHKLTLNNREVMLVVAQDITEHKLTEQKYQQIFENSLEGIFQSTPEGRFISLNPAMAHIYGYDSPQEMMDFIGNDISRVIYLDPKDRDQFTRGLQQADVIENFEMKNRRKDGSVIWTSTSARAVCDIEGKILYYEGFLQDITQRKHAEEELQASETRYRLATQATRDVIWEWSRATNQIMWSENAQLVFGYSVEEVGPSAKWWDEHLHPEDRDRVISALNLLLSSMEGVLSWTDEYRFQLKNGSYAYINDHAYIERDTDGKVMRMIGAMSDITERKQAETAIRNSEQKFRALIENGLDYISLLDGEGNLLWESPSSSNMLGFNFNEYVGHSIFELMHPEDLEWTSQQFAQLAQQPGHRITGIFRLQHSDGSWRWVEAIASNFLADPSVNAIVINYRDITERRQAELELEQRHADLGLVNAMNAALIRGESLHTVIDILADGLMNNFACQGTNVYLWDAETQALALQHYLLKPEVQHHIEETIGSTIPLIHMSLKTDGWFQRSLHSRQGLLLNQPETIREWLTEFWEAMAATLTANSAKPYNVSNVILGIQSAILVPLFSGTQIIGLLDLASARQLSETDLTRILNLSRQLTAAIQRQQADERVRRSENFLNSVQNSLLAHIAILDHQGNIVQVNSAWRKFAEQNGYEHPQYGVGLNYLEICDSAAGANAEGAQEVAGAIRQVLAGTRRTARVEYPCHSPEEKRWFVLRVTRFVNGDQNWVVLAHENITYRKQAEEAIRRSQSILAQAETMAHLGAWEIEVSNPEDINSNPARWSDEVYRILGYEPGEVEATNELFVERVHPQDREKIADAMHQAIAWNKPYAIEHRIIQPNGTERIVEEHANLIRDEYGRLVQILGAVQDITEHKQIEESLKRTSEQFRVLFEASPEAVMLIDPHGDWPIVDCNNAACLMNGYSRTELIGQPISILNLTPGDEAGRLEYLESIRASGVLRFDDLHRHKDGTVFPITTSTSLIKFGHRELVLGIDRDITDRKQAEQALQESREQYRNLVHQLPMIVYTDELVEGIGVTQFISPQIESITGFSVQEWLRGGFEGWKQQIDSEDRERIVEQYLQSLSKGEPFEAEYRLQTKTGQWIWMHDQFKVVLNAQNQPISSHGIMYDITERKEAEQAIQESEERYRTLVDQLPVIVYVDKLIDTVGVTQYVSPQIENIFGFTPEEWLAGGFELWRAQIHPEDRDRVLNEYQQCLETAKSFECEYRLRNKTGQLLWLHDQSKMVFDSHNQPMAAHGIVYDITAQKLYEEDRQRRVTELEALYENGLAISKLLDPKSISDKVVEVLAQKLHWHHAAIRFLHEETNQLVLVSLQHPGLSESQLREQIERLNNLISDPNKGLTGWAVKQHLPLRQGDLPSDPRYIETYLGMRSGLYVPIMVGDHVLGAISVESELPNAFTEQDERLLLTLANQAAVAIENAQLYLIVQKELDERQQAELRLRESEARQNGIIEAAMDAIITVDETQHIVLFNGAAERTFGCPVVEALGQPLERFLPERFRTQHKDHIRQFSQSNVITRDMKSHNEGVGLKVDGTEFPLEASISQISVAGTKLYTVILRDITERKIAEDELRQSEENYRLLFELSPEGIITHDGRQITFVNAAAAKLIGASSNQDLIGHSVLEFMHPDHHQLAIERIQKQAHGEHIEPVEEKFIRFDGSLVDVEVNAAPIRTQGKPAFLVTLRDITERKRAEEALRQSEEKYRFLAEDLERRVLERTAEVQDLYNNAPCGYHSLDEQGNIVLINETELKWLGYSREEILHRPFAEFLTNESRNVFSKSFPAFIKDGEIRDLEFDLIRKDGSTLPVLINATAIYDHQTGKYLTSRSTLFDNTDRKYALEALRLANNEMKRALRTKDEFLANMSHELRTPLNAILGLSESLLEQTAGNLNEKQHKYLTTINESGTHLLELINDILDLAKVEAGQIKLDPGKVDINNLCQSSLRMVKQLAQKKGQKVEVNIQDNIGFIWADERRIKQMLVNLLSNAVKFTPAGGQLGLNALIDFKESKLLLTVWDNGIGIRDEDLPRLFKPFVQLDSSLSRETSGTGLGLALVAQMARLHGGSISVSSVPGQGSRFTIVLPWDPALTAETLEKMKITGRFPVIKSLPGKPKTILLVEDTDSVVMLVRDYLELSGYKVELARDGITGVSKAIASQPDLILMDVQMPGMDGIEATRRIRQEPSLQHTPVIALTALAMANDRERCLEAGMNDYISKPVNLRQLVKTIQSYLSNSVSGDAA